MRELLENAKAENNFDREIQLSKALEDIELKISRFENEIDNLIYSLYNITVTEIVIIEKKQDRKIERALLLRTVILVMLLNVVVFIPGLIATAIILLTNNPELAFSIYIIFPLSLISTLFSIAATVGLLQHSFNYEFNNSLLILLVCFYPFFLFSFLLQLM